MAAAAKAKTARKTTTADRIAESLDSTPVTAAYEAAKAKAPNEGIEPGSPEFNWQHEYPGEAVFTFKASDGVTVGLAALAGKRKPRSGFLRKLRKEAEMEQMWTILELVSSPAALAVSDEFEDEDYAAMYNEWAEWSKTTVGESLR